MSNEVEVKVIRPPLLENIRSGHVFRPSRAFVRKLWVKSIVIAVLIWVGSVAGFLAATRMIHTVDPGEIPDLEQVQAEWTPFLMRWVLVLDLLWLVPALVITPMYVATMEYSVKAKNGGAMPEIYVKKGLFTVTQNHVPFRTITNISSVSGVFDRIFGIGSVHIETAGYSGQDQRGPEEQMEGIVFYEEVRDYILQELRKFRGPYVTTTEVSYKTMDSELHQVNSEILRTLKEINEDLKKEDG